jgi:NADH-quinone oxidoreductase subunit J
MMGTVFFIVCTLVCLVGALSTVLSNSPIRAAVGLLATIMGIAGLFLKLSAEFLAAIQLIVYAGAVVVLFVFVIMLLGPDANVSDSSHPPKGRFSRYAAATLMVLLSVAAVFGLRAGFAPPTPLHAARTDHGTLEAVGGMLFRDGIVPFEIATALLIVAVVGAIAVARTRPGKKKPAIVGHESKRLYAGPLHPRDAERPLPKGGES